MGGLFKGGSAPPPVIIPPAPPPAPTPMPDLGSQTALEAARKKALASAVGGREATILGRTTGGGAPAGGAAARPAAAVQPGGQGDYTRKSLGG